jgi:hypothetical protein
MFAVVLFPLLVPYLSGFKTKFPPIRSRSVTLADLPSATRDALDVFGELTRDLGNLGPLVPLGLGVLIIGRQDKKMDDLTTATRDTFLKDIKATNDAIKCTSELLSKDIKATNDAIKCTNDAIKCTNEALSKDIKYTNEASSNDISRLEKIVEKMAQK